jgi:hypothetical protein
MPRARQIAPRLAPGLHYIVRYGGARGPVGHIMSDARLLFTVCGLPIVIIGHGPWGNLSNDCAPRVCKSCERMKDADTVAPRVAGGKS